MATIQVRLDDGIKTAADSLFSSLGLDTSTAVRIFLMASLDNNGLPFPVKHRATKADAIEGTRQYRNPHGSTYVAEEAIQFYNEAPIAANTKRMRSEVKGCLKGKVWMAEDFDAPLEEMQE